MILLDTNVLARMTDSTNAQCAVSRSAVHRLIARGERLIIVPQNLFEFWVVATRQPGGGPAGQNGLGMTTDQAARWLTFFQRRFSLLPDREDLVGRWSALVASRDVHGFRAHDVRLVAAMQSYGIDRLLTFNTHHFAGLGIRVISPAES